VGGGIIMLCFNDSIFVLKQNKNNVI